MAREGMTTALIGKQGQFTTKARVALVSRGPVKHSVGATIGRAGHEVLEFTDWSDFAAAAVESVMDLVIYDDDQADEVPRQLSVPSMQIGEHPSDSRASIGCLSLAQAEAILDPLLRLVSELGRTAARCGELEHLVDGVRTGSALVGNSPVMRRLHGVLSRAADTDATVLIEGPRGSGKSLAARVIHCKSRRVDRKLAVVECADLAAEALTQALEQAKGSTLLLEDIDRLPAAAQSVLVRHLKERNSARAATAPRLISTTSAHLPELVARGAFREDLYYRLHAFPISVPALRERTEDVAMIAEAILDAASVPSGRASQGFTPAAVMLLESIPWPGNVTQLEAAVRRAQIVAGGGPIDREHLLAPQAAPAAGSATAEGPVRTARPDSDISEDSIRPFEEEEQELLSRALRATKGNVRRAAQLLGIGRATLYRKIQQYKLRLQ
jgi:DNA-binding NtrC family response regulator